eukprot:scaffold117820_cov16-Tisochrysis_lutea.AAC.2
MHGGQHGGTSIEALVEGRPKNNCMARPFSSNEVHLKKLVTWKARNNESGDNWNCEALTNFGHSWWIHTSRVLILHAQDPPISLYARHLLGANYARMCDHVLEYHCITCCSVPSAKISSRPTTPGSQTRILESPVPLPLYAPSNAVTRIGSPTSAAAAAARIGSPKGGRRLSGRLSTPPLVNSGSGGLNAGAGGNSSAAQQQQQQQQQQLQASAPGVPEVVVRVSGGLGQLMDLEAEAKQGDWGG